MTKTTHTVFGAGQVGRKLAAELLARGHEVRLVRRGAPGESRPGLTWVQGDVTDPAVADAACAGAEVVYNCVNPSDYTRWGEVLLPLYRAVRDGAARSGARLVGLDCLYMLGVPEGPIDEDTPLAPCSHKGELRAQLVEETLAAHARGDVHVTFGRSPDYVGPETPSSVVFHDRFLSRVRGGKAVEVFGDPDLPRSYAFTPDVARGLAILGTEPRALERRVWMLPVIAAPTTRALVESFFEVAGHPARLRRVPTWLVGGLGVFSPLMRNVHEMLYQWEHPYRVDDRRFREAFGVMATDAREVARVTLAGGDASGAVDAQAA